MEHQKKSLNELQGLEGVEERGLLKEENAHKKHLILDIKRLALMEETSWSQKSRALWLKEEINAPKFFHCMVNLHKRHNAIESLLVDGRITSKSIEIMDHINNHYAQLLSNHMLERCGLGARLLLD